MAYEQKPGTGSLWVNDRKTEDRHPDRTGTLVMPNGEEYFIDGWLKETKTGKKFLSLSVKLKKKQSGDQPQTQRPGAGAQQQRPPAHRPPPPPATNDGPEYGDKDAERLLETI